MEQELLDRLSLLASDEVRLTLFEARLAKYELFKAAQTERKEAS